MLDDISADESREDVGPFGIKHAKQGVLLLNVALTVERARPESHLHVWKPFTEKLIKGISKEKNNVIWVLWGAKAIAYKDLVDNETHHFICSSHPSPLAASKPCGDYPPFKGSRPFSKVNHILKSLHKSPIKW